MTFFVDVAWGSQESPYKIPKELLVDAVPTEGSIISFLAVRDDSPEPVELEVEVEEVILDATDPGRTRYKVWVIFA